MAKNKNDYFDFLVDDSSEIEEGKATELLMGEMTEEFPEWATNDNYSLAAYKTIKSLEKEKLKYIAENSTKKDFKKKFSFQISQAEVAREICAKPQPLFYSETTTYSEFLLIEFNETNNRLAKKKDNKLSSQKNGLRSRTKETLITEFRNQEKKLENNLHNNIDALYVRLKTELPYDVKAKLKIK